ncbi:hypoxanthine phosphoribosyltransferase [bacterium]|nr:hypoxanthine phosphoribosyltransferase [bacterium]
MRETIEQQLFSVDEIAQRVQELGQQLSLDYAQLDPLVVVVLKGSAVFASDLIRHMPISLQVDYIGTSSYGDDTQSSGQVRIVKDIEVNLLGRHVLIVEDIVDTGLTLQYLLATLGLREPASLKICALLDKPSRRRAEVPVDYVGFSIDDHFVIGYGLDYASRYRQLPFIGVLKLEEE